MLHIRKPEDAAHLKWLPCVHRPTSQRYALAPADGSVETIHGTMTFRSGEPIVEGADGATLYCLTGPSFDTAYYFVKGDAI